MRPRKVTDEDLLKYAVELTEANGLENLSLHKLSDKLGIKPASLYNHITSLSDLKRRIGVEAKRNFAQKLQESVADKVGAEGLRAYLDASVAFADERPQMFLAMISLPEKTQETEKTDREILKLYDHIVSVYMNDKEELQTVRRLLIQIILGCFELRRSNVGTNAAESAVHAECDRAMHYALDLIAARLN